MIEGRRNTFLHIPFDLPVLRIPLTKDYKTPSKHISKINCLCKSASRRRKQLQFKKEFLRMKREATISLSIAVLSLSLFIPKITQAKSMNDSPSSASATTQSFAMQEARLMVPAEVTLSDSLDARKMQPGQQFRAKLYDTIRLKNGPELPHDTLLIGTINTDQTKVNGTSKLALRFTQAKLKDGRVVPIKATIVQVLPPAEEYGYTYDRQDPNTFGDHVWQFDQLDALSGVDLHSQIANSNSGVFIATRKNDVKLPAGTEIELSITAAQKSGQQNANGASSIN